MVINLKKSIVSVWQVFKLDVERLMWVIYWVSGLIALIGALYLESIGINIFG